jgi:hypothetical protein
LSLPVGVWGEAPAANAFWVMQLVNLALGIGNLSSEKTMKYIHLFEEK